MTLVVFLARLAMARVFFVSGQTKVAGPEVFGVIIPTSVTSSTFFLFEYEYNLPVISPVIAAYAATIAEHLLPVLLVLGLGTRFATVALVVMTLVIQWVYPDAWWNIHMWWALVLMFIISWGPGVLSIDHLIHKSRARGGRGL
ncbi:MAG: DoxX family membrane protein [Parvularculales bacterium]